MQETTGVYVSYCKASKVCTEGSVLSKYAHDQATLGATGSNRSSSQYTTLHNHAPRAVAAAMAVCLAALFAADSGALNGSK